VVGGDRGVAPTGERDAQAALVVGVAAPDEEAPALQVLDQHRRRALGQQQVPGEPGQAGPVAHVGQQLALVLAEPVAVVVGPVERPPELSVEALESSRV
jgi:hypothetical protein